MQKFRTYFEQVPLEVVSKIIEEQSGREESAGQGLLHEKGTKVAVEPADSSVRVAKERKQQ